MTLIHSKSKLIERVEVQSVVTPEASDTWHPIPHDWLLDLIASNVGELGLKISNEKFALARDGQRFFGTMDLTNCNNATDYRLVLGIRNSHDKSFPAGLCVGSRVFVCDNLAFSSKITIARKHTRFIMRDLPALVNTAMGKLGGMRLTQDNRIQAYKAREISNEQAHDVVVRALDSRIISTTQIPDVLTEWRTPRHNDFKPRTAWSLFNAFTEHMKGTNPWKLTKRTTALHGLVDQVAMIAQSN